MPFEFAYRRSGGSPTIQRLIMADATFKKGDMVNLESGQADLGVTSDANLIGVVLETTGTKVAGTDRVSVITDADAVYRVADNNARSIGATLDLAGATGAQTVAASSNKEFVVVEDSTATQPTLVQFNVGKHFLNKAQ
jgi:hypothetical protein